MKEKIIAVLRKIEVVALKIILKIGRFFAAAYTKLYRIIAPRSKAIAKYGLTSLIVLYLIGGITFGVRLYKQKRYEKLDRLASYIYPLPVGHVGRTIIFSKELELKSGWFRNFARSMQAEIPQGLEQKILEDVVSDKIIMQEASRMKIKVTKKDLNDAFDQAVSGVGGEEQAVDFIKRSYGMSVEQFKKLIIPKLAMQKVEEQQFVKVKARHILVKDENKAKEIEKKIKDGGNFADLAKEFSEDQSSKDDGGMLAGGEFLFKELSGLPPEIEDAIFKLKAGEVSPIVKSSLGFHLLKVEEKQGTIDQKPTDWIESLKKKYPVRLWVK